jgi:hypothetical protein
VTVAVAVAVVAMAMAEAEAEAEAEAADQAVILVVLTQMAVFHPILRVVHSKRGGLPQGLGA